MQIIDVDQRSDEWFEARSGLITGTRVKDVKPLLRKGKTGKQPIGLWKLVTDYVSYGAEDMRPMQRGTLLEDENAELCVETMHLKNAKIKCGMWKADNGMLGYSPDASEDGEHPTWAIECKSLDTAEHLYLIMNDLWALGMLPDKYEELFPQRVGEYRGIDSVAEEHRQQVKQAFVVNPNLEVLYYSLYDPRIVLPSFTHYVITVQRKEMEDEIAEQTQMVERQASLARDIAILLSGLQKIGNKDGAGRSNQSVTPDN